MNEHDEDRGDIAAYLDGLEDQPIPAESDLKETVLILHSGSPLPSARKYVQVHHTNDNQRTIHHQNSTFYIWNNSHYIEMEKDEIKSLLYRFLDKAKQPGEDGKLVPFNPAKHKVANVYDALAAEAQISHTQRPPTWFEPVEHMDAHDIMSCTNGLVHLPTRTLHNHTPNLFTLNALPYDYQPDTREPIEWLNFLHTLWPHDQAAIDTLQEIFGLALTGETKYQKAFLIVGPKRSGKGTIARILTQMLGTANVAGPTLSNLGQNFGLEPLIGKRVALVSDARLSGKSDQQVIVERILSITGEDTLTLDRKHKGAWTGQIGARFVILTNELPRLTDSSGALAGRFVVLTMTKSFFGHEDLGLTKRLTQELPGILNWAMDGYDRLQARGYFVPPESSRRAQEEMEDLASPIGAFLREDCMVDPAVSVRCDDLFRAWCDWCADQGRDYPGSTQTFSRDLRAAVAGLGVRRPRASDGDRVRYYDGVALDPGRALRAQPAQSDWRAQYH